MILQALCDYYERKPDLPRLGFETKGIPFVIELNSAGEFVQFEDTRLTEGRKKVARKFVVPQGLKKSSGVAANLLWGNSEYVLGITNDGDPKKVRERHAAFLAKLNTLAEEADTGLTAVRIFLESPDTVRLKADPLWQEILTTKPDMTFRLQGDLELVCQRPAIRVGLGNAGTIEITCLVSGEPDGISDANGKPDGLHWSIKGVWGTQPSGANIVSFNKAAFNSFGKEQGANAPVGKRAAFAYTTAINYLLSKESTQRIQVGDASTVFWSEKRTDLEESFADLFDEPPKDDPARQTRAIEALFKAPQTGVLSDEGGSTRFYVLGLAPNVARISVRFWQVGTVAEMSARIHQHFDNIEIERPNYEQVKHVSLTGLLSSTANETKYDSKKPNLAYYRGKYFDVKPNLAGETIRAILAGLPYPQTLLQAAVRRIRAEREVTYQRAALIKACLNRQARHSASLQETEITVPLDDSNINPGYRIGRLFAALEKIQEEAVNPNATIRDRFYGAASSTPVTVFANLMKLKNHHLSKLAQGRKHYFEKLIGQITDGIDSNGFPAHLSLADQGRFAIGYYHQRQVFFTKS